MNGKSIDEIASKGKAGKDNKGKEVVPSTNASPDTGPSIPATTPSNNPNPLFFEEYFIDRLRDVSNNIAAELVVQKKSHEIDALYKLYTVLYKSKIAEGNGKLTVRDLLEDTILYNAAHILQIVYENRRGSICGKDCTTIRCFLGVMLYHLLHRYFDSSKNSIPFKYKYHWSYVDLFCHCIRHNTITKTEHYVEISNSPQSGGMDTVVLPRKLFVKLTVTLSNTVNMIINNEDCICIPREIGRLLNILVDETPLKDEDLDRLKVVLSDYSLPLTASNNTTGADDSISSKSPIADLNSNDF
jgi:hypothetical protein